MRDIHVQRRFYHQEIERLTVEVKTKQAKGFEEDQQAAEAIRTEAEGLNKKLGELTLDYKELMRTSDKLSLETDRVRHIIIDSEKLVESLRAKAKLSVEKLDFMHAQLEDGEKTIGPFVLT